MEQSCGSVEEREISRKDENEEVSTEEEISMEDVPGVGGDVIDAASVSGNEMLNDLHISEINEETKKTDDPTSEVANEGIVADTTCEVAREEMVADHSISSTPCSSGVPELNETALENLSVSDVNPVDEAHDAGAAGGVNSGVGSSELPQTTDKTTAVQHPEYNFECIKEIASSGSLFTPDKYLDTCKWSPDGSCLLTCCADSKLRLFDLPSQIYTSKSLDALNKIEEPLKPSLTISENGAIYDYDWFPFMSSWSPETACFVSASSSAPVHLIDAFTGTIRASYIGYNNVFEIASCFGLTFTFNGAKIYCGYRNMIKIFDVAVPGTTCQTLNTKRLNEQTGYISCIAQNPAMHCLFAAGSFSRTIGLYTEDGDAVCLLKGQRNGLTSLCYSQDGTKLFSGSRMDSDILCWDLRNPGLVLHVFPRVMGTNQRIRISVSSDGKHLLSGGTDGVVRMWKLDELFPKYETCDPTIKFKAHNDCVNGVSLNSKYPVLATSSGKRHTPDLVSDDESDQIFSFKNFSKKTENRVTLWWVGPQKSN